MRMLCKEIDNVVLLGHVARKDRSVCSAYRVLVGEPIGNKLNSFSAASVFKKKVKLSP
jgi:hypothetical protein